MKNTVNRLLLVFALCWVPAHAGIISYFDSGTFSASTPTTTFSGPGKPWAFSFQVDSSPVVSNVQLGIGFSPVLSNFSYTLNGSPVAVTPTSLSFFNASSGGGFSFCFINTPTPCTALSLNDVGGPQMYTGPESAPTMLTGGFTVHTTFAVGFTLYTQPNTTVQAAAVPEPSTLLTLAAGLLAVGGRRVYRRRRMPN